MLKKKIVIQLFMLIIVVGVLIGCGATDEDSNESATNNAENSNSSNEENQSYPEQEIELIVPFGAGGGTDTLARTVATALEEELGQSLVVVNKPSASGVVGSNEIASADTDGYTVGVFSNTDIANFVYAVETGVEFDLDSFTYLAGLNETGDLLVVPENSDINSLEDFVNTAKENPGEITVALPSKTQEVNVTLMESEMDIDVTDIVYESGNEVLSDLVGGHTESGILSAKFAEQADDQNLKVLGVMLDENLETFPDIPTFAEQGYDVSNPASRLLVGPADLPANVVETIETALQNAYDDELSDSLEAMDEVPRYRNVDEINEFLEQDFEMREEILSE